MNIQSIMSTEVCTARAEDSLQVPARQMWEHDCGIVPIVDAQLKVVGVITDRDICMAAYTQGKRLQEIRVREVISSKVVTCRPEESWTTVAARMASHQVRRLPVVDAGGKLVGIVSVNDLAIAAQEKGHPQDFTCREVGRLMAEICGHRVPLQAQPTPAPKTPALLK
jgi:CBS-domain-containing membrane protein